MLDWIVPAFTFVAGSLVTSWLAHYFNQRQALRMEHEHYRRAVFEHKVAAYAAAGEALQEFAEFQAVHGAGLTLYRGERVTYERLLELDIQVAVRFSRCLQYLPVEVCDAVRQEVTKDSIVPGEEQLRATQRRVRDYQKAMELLRDNLGIDTYARKPEDRLVVLASPFQMWKEVLKRVRRP